VKNVREKTMAITPKAPPPAPGISPFSILRALWKHKGLITIVWFSAMAITFAVVKSIPPVYQAEALVQVESQRIPENYVAATVHANLEGRINVLRQQILSYSRLVQVIEKYGLYQEDRGRAPMEEIVEGMRQDITIRMERGLMPGRPSAFAVGYRGPNPEVVSQVTNLLASFFIDENLRTREVEAVGTSEFLDAQLEEARKRLEEQEKQLSEFKLRHAGELPQQENALISSIAQARTELTGLQGSMSRVQQSKLMAQSALDAAETQQALLDRLSETEAGSSAQSPGSPLPVLPAAAAAAPQPQLESERLQAQLDNLRSRYSETHPDVRRTVAALARAREMEARGQAAAAQVRPAAPAAAAQQQPVQTPPRSAPPAAAAAANTRLVESAIAARERIPALRAQIAGWDKELKALEAEHQRLVNYIAGLQARINRLPLREQELAAVTRDYENTRNNYQSLLSKKMSADVAADMERRQKAERFIMLEPARVPERPVAPKKPIFYGGGFALGLAFGMALALGIEFKRDVLLGEWELPSGITILGRVPVIHPSPAFVNPAGGTPVSKPRPAAFLWATAVIVLLLVCGIGAGFLAGWFKV
jgi:polysaccharide chain length determinant protein (PEP-CTERM system associated)